MADEYISGEEHQAIKHSKTTNTKKVTLQVNYLAMAGIAVVLCVLSFYGGLAYQKSKDHSNTMQTSSTIRANGGFGGGFSSGHRSGGFGQVTSVSSTSITVSNQRTSANTTYTINGSTVVTDNGQTSSVSDIQIGDTVIITTSTSAPTTATRILVNPSFGGGGGGPEAQGSGSQTTN